MAVPAMIRMAVVAGACFTNPERTRNASGESEFSTRPSRSQPLRTATAIDETV